MTHTHVGRLLAGALILVGPMEDASPRRIERLRWLSGCWEQLEGRSTTEEFWTTPNGGILFGVGRTIVRREAGDTTASFEVMRIYERSGRLVFAASPTGQQPAEFTEHVLTDSTVVFANPTHDFPQFVRYSRRGPGELHARVDGKMNGKDQGFDFRYKRVACPG